MTFSDNFNRADSATTLGTPWTAPTGTSTNTAGGTWGISSNQAYEPSNTRAIAVVDAGSADGTLLVTSALMSGGGNGACFRVVDVKNYWFYMCYSSTAGGLWKVVNDVFTHVTVVSGTTAGDVIEIDLAGSSITSRINGSTVATTTDSFNATATLHGLYTETSASRLDSFSFTTPAPPRQKTIWLVGQGVMRSAVI